jgi:hypothetical protein
MASGDRRIWRESAIVWPITQTSAGIMTGVLRYLFLRTHRAFKAGSSDARLY